MIAVVGWMQAWQWTELPATTVKAAAGTAASLPHSCHGEDADVLCKCGRSPVCKVHEGFPPRRICKPEIVKIFSVIKEKGCSTSYANASKCSSTSRILNF